MFGSPVAFTVPDLDRTDYLVIIGANPLVSNGSLATAADFPGKLRALRKRGGRLVVIDPARTRTAELADRHLAPRPGTDAALLLAVVHVLFDEDLVAPRWTGRATSTASTTSACSQPGSRRRPSPPIAVCPPTRSARWPVRSAAAPTAAVYGRIGTSTVEFGTLGSWLVDVINILTGNLDRPGGAMFPLGAAMPAPRPPKPGRGFQTGRWHSRVSGYPEALSELPAAALAEEIDTPGEGQIKAMITIAGNPVLSAPDGDRLDRALDGVGFMLSIDPYLNETTRHADVILPPPPPSQSAHFDFALNNLAVRNNVRYSPPVLPLDDRPDEAEILSRIALILFGVGADGDPALVDEQVIATTLAKETADPNSPVAGRAVDELTAMLAAGPGYERRLDMMLRLGPYGDAFGAKPDGLTLERLKAAPHGIDLGPLRPRLPEVLRTPTGRIELAPEPLDRRRGTAAGQSSARRRGRVRAHRPAPSALQQQLDAQRACAGRGHEPVHAADPSRRRGRTGPRRHRQGQGPRRRATGAGRGDRRHAARRGVAPARVGPRPWWHAAGGRGRSARRQRQPTQRRLCARPVVGHRRAQRHSGRHRPAG